MSAELDVPIGPTAAARGCPPPEHVAALAGDALPPELRESVAAHVARCPACRALAADLASLAEAEVPAGLDVRALAANQTQGRWALLVAAAVLATIGLTAWWSVRTTGRPSAPPSQAAVTPAPRPMPTTPVGRWPIDKPDVVLPAATVLVMRGADPSSAALNEALEPYRANDFATAAARLQAFVSAHADSADGWFYLGATRLMLDASGEARAAFEKAEALHAERAHPELEWLLATSEARTGAIESARKRLTELCGTPGANHDRACAALAALK
jgi:hypothetical protein